MLRATPELAKLTTTRTGPSRSPQPLAARATCPRASTSAERLGRSLLVEVERAAELPTSRFDADARAPLAEASGRSAIETVGIPEPESELAVNVDGAREGS